MEGMEAAIQAPGPPTEERVAAANAAAVSVMAYVRDSAHKSDEAGGGMSSLTNATE